MVVVYILLFILCLSILIMIHELGHLLTAKAFKVYCFEYAIGFGPKLFSFKRKNGETYFSLRAIPFGGFVSMYGEQETVPEGLEIDPSRSLLSIKRWKRAIIMVAGVTMNFVLAILVFFIYEVAFPALTPRYSHVTVNSSSLAYEAGLRSGDYLYSSVSTPVDRSYIFYDDKALLTYDDESVKEAYFGYDYGSITYKDTAISNRTVAFKNKEIGSLTILDYEELTVSQILALEEGQDVSYKTKGFIIAMGADTNSKICKYLITENYGEKRDSSIMVTIPYDGDDDYKVLTHLSIGEELTVIGSLDLNAKDYRTLSVKENNYLTHAPDIAGGDLLKKSDINANPTKISFKVTRVDEQDLQGKGKEVISFDNLELSLADGYYKVPKNLGLNMQIDEDYNSFGDAVKNTFVDFGEGAIVIFKSFGMLLTDANSWKDVSGLIGIGVVTTRVLQDFGWGQFLYLWAIISVNLGIVNLFPFPGLDGWQLLVIAVEGITRKEIPAKVKGIVSIIGIGLLFAFMIAVLIKDLITFI